MSRPGTKTPQKKGQQSKQQPKPQAKPAKTAEEIAQAQTRAAANQAALDAKKEARMQRQAAAQAAAQRRRMMARLRRTAIITIIALVIIGGGVAYTMAEAGKPGESVAMLPSPHVSEGAAHAAYNTDPPTSGPHYQGVPAWGVHTEHVARELQVHALEDKGVVISYQPNLDKAVVDRLAELTRSYGNEVLLTPHDSDNLSNPIVLTAWRRIQRFDNFDEALIKKFIDAYRGIDHHGESGT